MDVSRYTASKTRSDGRPGWSVSFRHPLRMDSKGRPGVKMRRGLGTTDDQEADRLVGELNQILGDESLWSLAARSEAAQRFSPVVVEAFYAAIEAPADQPLEIRNEAIPLPGREEGYARVMLVGTTGAGKTTLLRHFIGSHPKIDRFPSTSTGKTTVADLELVTADGDFHGIATFLPDRVVRGYLQENLSAAALAALRGEDDGQLARQLLQHPDQKFRLHYVLGPWTEAETDEEEDWGFEVDEAADLEEGDEPEDGDSPNETERRENHKALEGWVARIRELAAEASGEVSRQLQIDWRPLKGGELEAAEEFFLESLEDNVGFEELVQEIRKAVLRRFEYLEGGQLTRTAGTGWPIKWENRSADRREFLQAMRRFSSNYASRYGRLLTPLVQGMRVRGPFAPAELGEEPRLVLIDGQGLGHTPDSASSVSTSITSRFGEVDVILLVDSSKQPMQAAPLSVVRAVAVGGFQDKLAIAFTHFDQVQGANLPTVAARREHVLFAIRNALNNLRGEIGASAIRSVEQELESRCFTLGWLDRPTERLSRKMKEQLTRLFAFFRESIRPEEPTPARPVYDSASLLFAVQAATQEFHTRWEMLLGLKVVSGVRKEHWTRIKALNRRIADRWPGDEYDTLKPVADLFSQLSERISAFLDQPVEWKGGSASAEERLRAIDGVRRSVSGALFELARSRLIEDNLTTWVDAYGRSGPGSTRDRARAIRDIYEDAAPVPGVIIDAQVREFLDELRTRVHEGIANGGGEIGGEMPRRTAQV